MLVGLATSDDAAVYRVSEGLAVVLTIDFITPLVDDPYQFGRIAATNAFSDIYAMGARPVIALNVVAFPSRSRPLDELNDILRGGSDQAAAAGVTIAGGHSIDDPEPKYGLCVMGFMDPNKVLTNSGAKAGDRLILTKPIGTGIVATAIKHGTAPAEAIGEALQSMTTLNGPASEVAMEFGCSACTDVSGFGLLGHLREMTCASVVGARVRFSDVPFISGLAGLLRQEEAPGGTYSNLDYLNATESVVWPDGFSEEGQLALSDAQTAGGLLLTIEADRAAALKSALLDAGVLIAAEIGEMIEDARCRIYVEQ